MFSSLFQRRIIYILLAALILPAVGPWGLKVHAADRSTTLEADSGGEALVVTGLIVGAIILIARGIRDKHRREHYEQGRSLLEQGIFDAAIRELTEAKDYRDAPVLLEKAKESSCVYHYKLVKEAVARQNYLSAYNHSKIILALNPDYKDIADLHAQIKTWLKPFLTVRIGVLDFENRGSHYNLGHQATSLLVTEIVKKDIEFVEVIERVELEKLLQEQNLWRSGYLEPQNAQEVGKLLGLQYLVIGDILDSGVDTNTTYTVVKDEDKVKVRYRLEREAQVSAGFRVIDTGTGAVVVSDSITESAHDVDYSYWRWGFGSLDSESELLQEALKDVINRFSTQVTSFLEKEVSKGLEGRAKANV